MTTLKRMTVAEYVLFYCDSRIDHILYYKGMRIFESIPGNSYVRVRFREGSWFTLKYDDIVEVRNKDSIRMLFNK